MRRLMMLAACVGALSACSGGDKAATDSSAVSTVATEPPVVTIVARDFVFQAPDTIQSGMVTLRLVNEGPALHHVQLVRLDDGKTYAELMEGMKTMKPTDPMPPWMHDVAGPNTPVPGGEQSITQDLAPGTYALLCFIPGPDQIPHVAKGMSRELTVLPNTGATATAPNSDITVKMTDYAWDISPQLTAGKHVMRLENDAAQSHEMFIFQLAPGKSAADLGKWVEKQEGPPPGKPIGGTSGMSKGDVVYLPVDLEPGEYGLFCFLPDSKDGKMHVEHGMMRQITVK